VRAPRTDGKRGWVNAIVGQPYNHSDYRAELDALEHIGLAVHLPPDPTASIHFPGACRFIVVTLPAHACAGFRAKAEMSHVLLFRRLGATAKRS
jgi:hypothetical protein